jgi:hypothetical protein
VLTQQQAQERVEREWKSTRHQAAEEREVIPAVFRLDNHAPKPPITRQGKDSGEEERMTRTPSISS